MSIGRIPIQRVRLDYSSTNVTTGAWVELLASCPRAKFLEIFDSGGRVMELSHGATGSENASIFPFYIVPGGKPTENYVPISEGQRLSIRAVDASATNGQIILNFSI